MADLKELARNIFDQVLADCSIERSFGRILHIAADAQGARLVLGTDDVVALDRLKQVRILSIGKAAAPMLQALLSRLPLPPSCDLQGVLIAPGGRPPDLPATIQFFAGGHPYPNAASFAGASAALSMLDSLGGASPDDALCIFLISGGASAMMELPLDRTISLDDTVAFHRSLVAAGATIVEMNCVRKHFSAVKGGRLAVAAGSAQKISLLVSDVPPLHLDALASGPTIPDPTTVAQCREILARYSLLEQFPASVRSFFASPDLPETPKPGQVVSPNWKALDSEELANCALHRAAGLGFHAVIDNTCDDWTYDAAADYLLSRLRQLRREHPRVCLISTGEVTVQLPHAFSSAKGGRNQHFALYAATRLRPSDAPIAILSAGSDGIDGNSVAAGAFIDDRTLDQASLRAQAQHALDGFDSYPLLSTLGATVVTGPTGHNLRDLRILLADSAS
jgi:hydroxypyruvate reductase